MKLIHIRVPGRNSNERLNSMRDSYIRGELNSPHLMCPIEIRESEPFWVGARYSHPDKKADEVIKELAESADAQVREALRVGLTEVVVVTDARFVIVVADERGGRCSSDQREAKARANASFFDRSMWTVITYWYPKNWSRPRVVIYDYYGRDGRKVWSWVFHFGPWWFVRERYAL